MLQYCVRLSSSVCTECIVAKRCVPEQKLLLTAYRKSYTRNRLVPKWMTLSFIFKGRLRSRPYSEGGYEGWYPRKVYTKIPGSTLLRKRWTWSATLLNDTDGQTDVSSSVDIVVIQTALLSRDWLSAISTVLMTSRAEAGSVSLRLIPGRFISRVFNCCH